MVNSTGDRFRQPLHIFSIWVGWALGPFAWALHQNLSYLSSHWVCRTQNYLVMDLITAATLIIAGAGTLIAWRQWRRAGNEPSHSDARSAERSRFLAAVGLMIGAVCIAGILVEHIPNALLACDLIS